MVTARLNTFVARIGRSVFREQAYSPVVHSRLCHFFRKYFPITQHLDQSVMYQSDTGWHGRTLQGLVIDGGYTAA